MVSDRAQPLQQSNVESFQSSKVESTSAFNSLDLLKSSNDIATKVNETKESGTKAEPDVLNFTNPFSNRDTAEPTLVADNKPLRKSELPDQKKYTPEEQAKTAADLAKEITKTGFTPSPELRDKVRQAMLKVYVDGDMNGPGNQKAMEKFVEQMSEKLPKGMSLKIDSSETNKDLAAFREKAQAAIDKQPGMQMGTSGQLQLCKTEGGKTVVADKLHFAASIKKTVPVKV